jgi:hypothetical protein
VVERVRGFEVFVARLPDETAGFRVVTRGLTAGASAARVRCTAGVLLTGPSGPRVASTATTTAARMPRPTPAPIRIRLSIK